jgi:beta-1,2-mannosidase
MRPDKFDSLMVEGGPPPLKLSDGNYLYIYNSARQGFPSPKPGYNLQYNVGWLILDGQNPTKILQRCDEPLLSPELPWEIGMDLLTPNVVFLEGLVPYPDASAVNSFLGFYGAADQVVGSVRIEVTISND